MRSLLLATALALTSLVPADTADACGGYYDIGPTLFLVSSHRDRAFVLMQQVDPEQHAWAPMDPRSFDRTTIAPAPAFATPLALTLVGPSGTKHVTTRTQVHVDNALDHDGKPMSAAQVPRAGTFRVALVGTHDRVTWKEIEPVDRPREAEAWARTVREAPRPAWISRVDDVRLLTVVAPERGARYTTYVEQGGSQLGAYTGIPLGVIDISGKRYAVLASQSTVQTVRLR